MGSDVDLPSFFSSLVQKSNFQKDKTSFYLVKNHHVKPWA